MPDIPSDRMEAVVLDIESRPLVHDAAIVQKRSCQQNLAVMANPIISDEYARQLADNFVRLTKALGLGPNPTREIGKERLRLLCRRLRFRHAGTHRYGLQGRKVTQNHLVTCHRMPT